MFELASQQDLALTNYKFNEVLVEEKLGSFTVYNYLFNIGFIIFYICILLHSFSRLDKHRPENLKVPKEEMNLNDHSNEFSREDYVKLKERVELLENRFTKKSSFKYDNISDEEYEKAFNRFEEIRQQFSDKFQEFSNRSSNKKENTYLQKMGLKYKIPTGRNL